MTLDYSKKYKVKIDMRDYVNQMINQLPIKLDDNDTEKTPANENLFKKYNSKMLSKYKEELFHTITAKSFFLKEQDQTYNLQFQYCASY